MSPNEIIKIPAIKVRMAQQETLGGFADSDAWMAVYDNNGARHLVGRKRNGTYKEVLRHGLPWETLAFPAEAAICEEVVPLTEEPKPFTKPIILTEEDEIADPIVRRRGTAKPRRSRTPKRGDQRERQKAMKLSLRDRECAFLAKRDQVVMPLTMEDMAGGAKEPAPEEPIDDGLCHCRQCEEGRDFAEWEESTWDDWGFPSYRMFDINWPQLREGLRTH